MSNVTHPSHYNQGKIEVIEFIEDQRLGYHLGNTVKYVCRAGKKDENKTIEDLEKAKWYLARAIELMSAARSDRPATRPNDMNVKQDARPDPSFDTIEAPPGELHMANLRPWKPGVQLREDTCGHLVVSGWRCHVYRCLMEREPAKI